MVRFWTRAADVDDIRIMPHYQRALHGILHQHYIVLHEKSSWV
jgi:hypothetical protein